jgi:hypothetical protein
MGLKVSGMAKTRRLLNKITPAVTEEFEKANRDNAELIVAVARVLVPVASGTTRRLIKNVPAAEGGQIISFGPLSKILEGGTGVRTTKTGASRGVGSKRAFKNPAMKGTKKRRDLRNRQAVKAAIRIAKNG